MSSPSTVLPLRNSTLVTLPSESAAVALMVNVALRGNSAPLAGDVMLAVGGAFTVIVDTGIVVVAPALSVALAVSS